jgi:DNA-binding transcriptional LysR family regulator
MFDELRHFVLVVEHGTLTAAARRAHLSQPALTASLQRLEGLIGAKLLHRGPGGASLTAAGEALLPRARAALAAVEDGRRAVAEVMGLHAGEVRLGAGATACTYLLPPVLARFRKMHPGVRFLLRETTPGELADALAAGTLDLGIVTSPEGEPWRDDPLVLVAAPGVDPEDCPFITFPEGSTTRRFLDLHFPKAAIVMELNSIASVKGHVRAGIGMTLVSRSAVESDITSGRLVLVPHPATPIPRTLSLVHRGVDRLPPAAGALRELLLASRSLSRPTRRAAPGKGAGQ